MEIYDYTKLNTKSPDSSVGIATRLRAGQSKVLGFDSRRGLGIFLFTTACRTALGPTQPSIQWVQGALSVGLKRPGREVDHSPPPSTEVKNAWSHTSIPQCIFMARFLVKYRDNFTFTVLVILKLVNKNVWSLLKCIKISTIDTKNFPPLSMNVD
jgi:hypothetical protein